MSPKQKIVGVLMMQLYNLDSSNPNYSIMNTHYNEAHYGFLTYLANRVVHDNKHVTTDQVKKIMAQFEQQQIIKWVNNSEIVINNNRLSELDDNLNNQDIDKPFNHCNSDNINYSDSDLPF